jgi:ABC-type transport system involved in multi-copper enzyme maturation permease subunit
MNSSSVVYAVRWLIVDTFRQATATRIFWIMLAVSGVFIVFCLTAGVSGGIAEKRPDDTSLFTKDEKPLTSQAQAATKLSFLFGAVSVEAGVRTQEDAVHFLEVMLATMVASYLGFLLTVLWTAGFLPEFLQPSAASVLFAKPVPRWVLLVGKYLGVLAFVTFQVAVFFVGTWLALGLRTGYWRAEYLAGIPLLVINFAVIYSFAVLLAVLTRSTVACAFGSILFWALCWGVNYGHHWTYAAAELAQGQGHLSPVSSFLIEVSYWVLPKPADMEWILQDALESSNYFAAIANAPGFKQAIAAGAIDKLASVGTAVLFAVVMLIISSRHLGTTDY